MPLIAEIQHAIRKETCIHDITKIIGVVKPSWPREALHIKHLLRLLPDKYLSSVVQSETAARLSDASVTYKEIKGGLMNTLYGCRLESDVEETDMVLLRVYGDCGDHAADRERELLNMIVLHDAGCGQPLYDLFLNGVTYRYNPGTALNQDSITGHISRLIAKEFAKIQSIDCEDLLKMHPFEPEVIDNFLSPADEVEYALFHLSKAPDTYKDKLTQQRAYAIMTKKKGREELAWLKTLIDTFETPLALCNSNPVPQNIIYDAKQDAVQVIDWEWGRWMNTAYDVGAFFTSLATGFSINLDSYPCKGYQIQWIRWFLEYKAEFQGRDPQSVDEESVLEVYNNSKVFSLVYLLIGIFWGLKQIDISRLDFDFLSWCIGMKNLYKQIEQELLDKLGSTNRT